MVIIGIVGEIGSGKDTFSSHFIKIANDKKIVRVRFSDILKQTLDLWSIPVTRHNLQYLAIIMDKEFGVGTLTNALRQAVIKEKADIVIIEGVRWLSDVPLIRSFEKNYLVYITSDQNIRYERVKKRGEKVDEKSLTIDRFRLEDKEPTETHILEIGKDADIKIENNKTLKEFIEEIKKIYKIISE